MKEIRASSANLKVSELSYTDTGSTDKRKQRFTNIRESHSPDHADQETENGKPKCLGANCGPKSVMSKSSGH